MSLGKGVIALLIAGALAFAACGEDEPTIPDDPDDIPTPATDDLELEPADDERVNGEDPVDVTILDIVDTLMARGVDEERATCLAEVVLQDMNDDEFTPRELRKWFEEQPDARPVEDSLESETAQEDCPE